MASTTVNQGMGSQNTPKVSAIIPTYNRAGIVPKAIESVFNQTYPHYELIVVDDGSTDETQKVVEKLFRGREEQCRYVFQQNRGEPAARNAGISVATGDYVAFLDSDDWWLPEHLESCVNALAADPSLGAVFTDHFITQDGVSLTPTKGKIGKSAEEMLRNLLVRELVLASDAIMIKRGVFSQTAGFNEELQVGTDWEMWVRLASVVAIGYVPKLTVVVLQHPTNTSMHPEKIEKHAKLSIDAIMKNAKPEVLALRKKVVAELDVEIAYFYSLSGTRWLALKKLASAVRADTSLMKNAVLKRTIARIVLGRNGFERLRSAKQSRSQLQAQSSIS